MGVFDRYLVVATLGSGGMGRVYLAVDKKLNKKWAIKEIRFDRDAKNDMLRESFAAELNALKSFDYPTLPRIVDVYEEKNAVYLVMDYEQGKNLRLYVQEKGGLGQRELLKIAMQLVKTLEYLHTRKIPVIYRDLKPSNIIVKPDGSIKLVDFGASVLISHVSKAHSIGTRQFAAPEQLKGKADERSDIYSFGKTMLYAMKEKKPVGMFGVIVLRCMKLKPSERYQTASEVKAELQKLTVTGKKRGKWFGVLILAALSVFFTMLYGGKEGNAENGEIQTAAVSDDALTYVEKLQSSAKKMYDKAVMGESPVMVLESGFVVSSLEGMEAYNSALTEAAALYEQAGEIISEGDIMVMRDCMIENLSMLSTVYRLLGKHGRYRKNEYYEKAVNCLEQLLDLKGIENTSLFKPKLSELVAMKGEMGDLGDTLEYIKRWEDNFPNEGKEFYFAHAFILLENKGNEQELYLLYKKMKDIEEVREDDRYDVLVKRIEEYLVS